LLPPARRRRRRREAKSSTASADAGAALRSNVSLWMKRRGSFFLTSYTNDAHPD
jgi:hypothetical protein